MGTLITISDAYRASLVADGNAGTPAHRVVEIGLATAPFDSSSRSLTQLPGEHKRITTFGARNIAADTIHVTLQDSTSDQYSLYGFGLYLENGVLAAYYSQKAADGPIMEKSPVAMLLLSADMQFVSVDVSKLVFGDATFLNPPATTEVLGVVELATQDEVNAGADASRVLTPKTAAKRYAALTGADFSGPISAKNVSFGAGARRANISSDATTAYYYGDGNVWFGSSGPDGMIGLVAGNREAARILPNGRLLVGTTADDGSGLMQVGGSVRIDGSLSVRGMIGADVTFSAGKRLILDEGSAAFPSLTFVNDGAPDTGFYHVNDGSFGITCNAIPTVTFSPAVTTFRKPVTGPTPPSGDNSILLATTAWVTSTIALASVGQIVMEPRTSARAGYLKANGAVLNRADYPALWAYAQASGALVAESAWSGGNLGCFSSGDGATTFRIPEMRGEHPRFWDDGRGIDAGRAIGSWQDSQNRSHAHGASADGVGDHTHGAWTDTQGWHGHHGNTSGVGDHTHQLGYPVPQSTGDTDRGGASSSFSIDNPVNPWTNGAGAHSHSFDTEGAGNHGHNVGIGGGGNHSHIIRINADGGAETRVRTVALLAMIRAF